MASRAGPSFQEGSKASSTMTFTLVRAVQSRVRLSQPKRMRTLLTCATHEFQGLLHVVCLVNELNVIRVDGTGG